MPGATFLEPILFHFVLILVVLLVIVLVVVVSIVILPVDLPFLREFDDEETGTVIITKKIFQDWGL